MDFYISKRSPNILESTKLFELKTASKCFVNRVKWLEFSIQAGLSQYNFQVDFFMENVISKYFCIGHFLIDFLSTFFENMINYETVISLQGISAKKNQES